MKLENDKIISDLSNCYRARVWGRGRVSFLEAELINACLSFLRDFDIRMIILGEYIKDGFAGSTLYPLSVRLPRGIE